MMRLGLFCLLVFQIHGSHICGQTTKNPCQELKEAYLDMPQPSALSISLSYGDSLYRFSFSEIEIADTSLNSGFSIHFRSDSASREKFKGLLTYRISGIKFYRVREDNFQKNVLLYSDEKYSATFVDEWTVHIPKVDPGPYLPGARYYVRFDTLVQIACNKHVWAVDDFSFEDSYRFDIACRALEDSFFTQMNKPANENFPEEIYRPNLFLLLNGKDDPRSPKVREEDSLVVDLVLDEGLTLGKGERIWINGITIYEKSCYGLVAIMEIPASDLPLVIPHNKLKARWGGKYYVGMGEVLHTQANGRIFRVPRKLKWRPIFYK